MNDTASKTAALPEISLLVPSHGRPEDLANLVSALKGQTVEPHRFELIVVDDGGDPPVSIDEGSLPFRTIVLRQPNGGPAAARNAGLALCRAELVLILNDDAIPAPDLVESHLRAHDEVGDRTAVMGTFRFDEASLESPFVRLLEGSSLLFDFPALRHGEQHDWTFFWTCNISLPTAALLEVGGFDEENFDKAICEDVELGLRLQKLGYAVVYREDCVAHHHHELTPASYMRRAVDLGVHQLKIEELHGIRGLAWSEDPARRAKEKETLVNTLEAERAWAENVLAELEAFDAEYRGRPIPDELSRKLVADTQRAMGVFRLAGLHLAEQGVNPLEILANGPPAGVGVAVVIVSCDALENTRRCVETLKAKEDRRHPQTIVVVDNGSSDGSAEWLACQEGVHLIRNEINHGAPRARNQAIRWLMEQSDRPKWFLFLDNDVFVTEGWARRALYHGEVDPAVGSVALCAARASKKQVVPYDGPDDQASLDAFAGRHADDTGRRGVDTTLFTSFAVLVRSVVIDRIGGFDEAFSPWGFEDDDISLRIRLAGWRNRVAMDTYVHHAHYGTREKSEWHDRWMAANWNAFVDKWCPSASGAALFDYASIQVPQPGQVTELQLVFPVPSADAAAPVWEGSEQSRRAFIDEPGEPVAASASGGAPTSTEVVTKAIDRAPATAPEACQSTPVLVLGTSPGAAQRLADALGGAPDDVVGGVQLLNDYVLAGTSVMAGDGLWLGDLAGDHPAQLSGLPASFTLDTVAGAAALADPRLLSTIPRWREMLPKSRVLFVVSDPAGLHEELEALITACTRASGPHLDAPTALGLWRRAGLRALELADEDTAPWLFVDEARLGEPGIRAAIQAFTARPVQPVSPAPGAVSSAPFDPSVEAIHAALMARANGTFPSPAPASPEVSALITADAATLEDALRTARALSRQTVGDGIEIVVAARDDVSVEAAAGAADRVRVVDARSSRTLGGALNAAARSARGTRALLMRGGVIPATDLVEQHLAGLAEAGPSRGSVGALQAVAAHRLRNIEVVTAGRSTLAGACELPTGRLHEWNRFDGRNVMVPLDDLRTAGLFDEEIDDPIALDLDLAFRLQDRCGTRFLHAPHAVAERSGGLDLAVWRSHCRGLARGVARTIARHQGAALQREIRDRVQGTTDTHTELVISTLEGRGRLEAAASELSQVDLGALERSGREGAATATVLRDMLAEQVAELEALYLIDAELAVMNEAGVRTYAALAGSAASSDAPPTTAPAATSNAAGRLDAASDALLTGAAPGVAAEDRVA